jgi:hypothetical protein
MHKSTLDLFCEHAEPDEQAAEDWAFEIEKKAAELEVTCDYYMYEFL